VTARLYHVGFNDWNLWWSNLPGHLEFVEEQVPGSPAIGNTGHDYHLLSIDPQVHLGKIYLSINRYG